MYQQRNQLTPDAARALDEATVLVEQVACAMPFGQGYEKLTGTLADVRLLLKSVVYNAEVRVW